MLVAHTVLDLRHEASFTRLVDGCRRTADRAALAAAAQTGRRRRLVQRRIEGCSPSEWRFRRGIEPSICANRGPVAHTRRNSRPSGHGIGVLAAE